MYQYFDLDDKRFENLVIAICKKILGEAVQGFSTGKDGGKDGEFVGIANLYPSEKQLWKGRTIIQAKHTQGVNKHFLDSDFFGNKSCILAQEVEKVRRMQKDGLLDHYMLFANRNLTGGAKGKIISYIMEETDLKENDIAIFGNDDLDHYLACYSDIPDMKNIDLEPLNHAPDLSLNELAEVIGHFSDVFDSNKKSKKLTDIIRTSYKEKNELNNLRSDSADALRKYYMGYTQQIEEFLNDPQNKKLQECYENSVQEFQLQYIIPKQRELEYFDEIFNDLVKYLIERDYILGKNPRLTRMMVFYMYWNCDIGKVNDTPE